MEHTRRLNLRRWGAGVGGLLGLPAALGSRPGFADVAGRQNRGPRVLYHHPRRRRRRAQLIGCVVAVAPAFFVTYTARGLTAMKVCRYSCIDVSRACAWVENEFGSVIADRCDHDTPVKGWKNILEPACRGPGDARWQRQLRRSLCLGSFGALRQSQVCAQDFGYLPSLTPLYSAVIDLLESLEDRHCILCTV